MCQELHDQYNCNSTHTTLVRPLIPCGRPWVPGLLHQKIKVIRQKLNYSCPNCSWGPIYIPARTSLPTTYTVVPAAPAVPVIYTQATMPARVIVKPVHTLVVPAPQPTPIFVPLPPPQPVPTMPQQTPGPGSGGAPLAVPEGTVVEYRLEYMKSKGRQEWVAHYKKDPATPSNSPNSAGQRGYNTIHGTDPGPPPPGWGAQTNLSPANRTGYNTTHGADPGPLPPGMGGLALVPMSAPGPIVSSAHAPASVPVPQLSLQQTPPPTPQPQQQARPRVHFASPAARSAAINEEGSGSSSADLTETSTDTSDTETSTTGSSTSTATV